MAKTRTTRTPPVRKIALEFGALVLGLVIAGGLVFTAKKLLPISVQLSPTRQGVFALEVIAITLLLGSFVVGEILHVRAMFKDPKQRARLLTLHDIGLVLGTIASSLLIYVAIVAIAGPNLPP